MNCTKRRGINCLLTNCKDCIRVQQDYFATSTLQKMMFRELEPYDKEVFLPRLPRLTGKYGPGPSWYPVLPWMLLPKGY